MIGHMTLRRRLQDHAVLIGRPDRSTPIGDPAAARDADEVTARMIVRTSLRPGLSMVYQALLCPQGEGIHLLPVGALAGLRFGDALHRRRASTLIGLRRADGSTLLNPPMELVIERSDELIAIGMDPLGAEPDILEAAIVEPAPRRPVPRRTLVLGWNRRAAAVVRHFDHSAPPGSRLDIVADEPDAKAELDTLRPSLQNVEPSFTLAGTETRGSLESADPASYDHVIVLSRDQDDADDRALITLLHLREIGARFSTVTELTDDRNRTLAQTTDDFIVGPHPQAFAGLFGGDAEIELRPAGLYVWEDAEMTFHTVVEAARRRGELAIGYRLAAQANRPPSFGVVLNPDKSLPLTFGPDDLLIVLAGTD